MSENVARCVNTCEYWLGREVPIFHKQLGYLIVTLVTVIFGFTLMSMGKHADAIVPVITLALGHFYGSAGRKEDEKDHKHG